MTPDELMPGDVAKDHATADSIMMLRRWYLSAVPSPERRQQAIDRLVTSPRIVMSAPHRRLAGPAPRRWPAGAAVAACVVAAVALAWSLHPGAPTLGQGDGTRLVAFEVRLPSRQVHAVALAGDFNGWDPHATPMAREGSSDLWKIAIPLPPGRHVYSFVVDGTEWVIDPLAPSTAFDELGPANVIAISGAGD